VWSDNFNDGNHVGWTVYNGEFNCAGSRCEGWGAGDFNDASHPSTVAVGTWSFDVDGLPMIHFMASDLDPTSDWPDNSYAFTFDPVDGCWRLIRMTGGAFYPLRRSYEHIDGSSVSVVITRNATDFIHIWINDDLCMTDQDTTHSSSEYFYIRLQQGTWIDNIVVSDTVDRRPEYDDSDNDNGIIGIDPVLLAAALGVVAVVIIIVVAFVVIRRRK
jgi:hypothetical protein